MKSYTFKNKTEDLAINDALSSLNLNNNEIVYKVNYKKDGILSKKCEIEVFIINDIIRDIKVFLDNILKLMELESKINIKYKDKILFINIDSKDNKILIGKNGDVLRSFRTLIYSYIRKYIDINVKLDIGSYQKNIDDKFVRNIKKIVKEVKQTGITYKLDSMNSYQRKIVHDVVSKFENITSKSYGEEPNRYIEIKRK